MLKKHLSFLLLFIVDFLPLFAQDFEGRYIAHAGGNIDNHIYTNTLEALDKSYADGFRYFELDFLEDVYGNMLAVHELEETIIGDLTYLQIDASEKEKIGHAAVEDILKEFKKLENIEFHKCKISKIDFSNLNKKVRFSNCGILDFKYPIGEYVDIEKSEVNFENINFENVKYVYIIDSIINNSYNLDIFKNIEIVCLDGTKIYDKHLNVIKDIRVANSVKYSHKKEIDLFN